MAMIGLTGGIGSGKSTVAAMLQARGAIVIDADKIARAVVEPGMPALAAVAERFGGDVIGADGRLDRPKLAARAFVTPEDRKDLEAITHPAIGAEFLRLVAEAPAGAVVVHDVPLLAESLVKSGKPIYDYAAVIVVETPLEVRLERLEARDVPRDDALRRIAQQASDEERRAVATYVLDNRGDRADLERQVDDIWPDLERLAKEPPPVPAEGESAE